MHFAAAGNITIGTVMSYNNGTYVSFHLGGTYPPFESDAEWYAPLKSWTGKTDTDFIYVATKDKELAATDARKRTALRMDVQKNLRNSRHLMLILDDTTHLDNDWVPFEIEYAVDQCEIPIIAVYPGYNYIIAPDQLRNSWPDQLTRRIDDATARVVHIPFKKEPVASALESYNRQTQPRTSLSFYRREQYQKWGLLG